MGSGNVKGKLVKQMTTKQIERVTIMEERHNLVKELSIITGEEIIRRPVPDWRWSKDIAKTERENFQSKSTLDKSKSINDDVEGNKGKLESKSKPKSRSKANAKSNPTPIHIKTKTKTEGFKPMISIAQPPNKKQLTLKTKANIEKTQTKTMTQSKNKEKMNTVNSVVIQVNKSKQPNQKLKANNEFYIAMLARIKKDIQEGKQAKNEDKVTESNSRRPNHRFSIGQPADSDYEYEY